MYEIKDFLKILKSLKYIKIKVWKQIKKGVRIMINEYEGMSMQELEQEEKINQMYIKRF